MTLTLPDIYEAKVAAGTLQPDDAQRAALPLLEEVRVALMAAPEQRKGLFGLFAEKPAAIPGLYLWGGVGRGKSMLMDLFFDHVEEPRKLHVHFHAFMQRIHTEMHEARKTGVDDPILPVAQQVIEEARLLCFDEMQITDITDAMIVGRLFEQLFNAGVVIVTTSNRVPGDLYKDGLNRNLFEPFIGMIEAKLKVHELATETDYRQDRLTGAQVYFSPANATAREKIDMIWDEMSGGPANELSINVKGRQVILPAFRNGVARASFFELCGKPLGPADYLAMAERVKVLIIDNIPSLSRDNFNEAKRFVTMIDALYEAKVRLICSAADIPSRLYLEGEGVFEFERTASRLMEMQSEDWTNSAQT